MTYISSKTARAYTAVADPTKIQLPIADVQAMTPGAAYHITTEQLQRLMETRLITSVAHGLVAGDVGKPLSGVTIFDDTDSTHFPNWVLVQVVDVDTVRVALNGQVSFSDSLMEVGYDLGTDGPYVYWDESEATYVATKPGDSIGPAREILYVKSVAGGTVTAEILNWGPPGGAAAVSSYTALTAAAIVDDTAVLFPVEDSTPYKFSLDELKKAVGVLDGSGSPEGVVTAAVGTIYRRSDGGANTSIYVKESGSGNTGWVGK